VLAALADMAAEHWLVLRLCAALNAGDEARAGALRARIAARALQRRA
jgi:hypothetical protein